MNKVSDTTTFVIKLAVSIFFFLPKYVYAFMLRYIPRVTLAEENNTYGKLACIFFNLSVMVIKLAQLTLID
jgi:hypothetical protein